VCDKTSVVQSKLSHVGNRGGAAVQPHLEYMATMWSPHLQKDIATLEKTQYIYFAAKICTKNWNAGYHDLLDMLELPPFAQLATDYVVSFPHLIPLNTVFLCLSCNRVQH